MSKSVGPLGKADWTERYERLRAAAHGPPREKANGMRLFLRLGMVGWMFAWESLVGYPLGTAGPIPRATSNRAVESRLQPEPPVLARVAESLARMLLHRVLGTTS